MRRLITVVIWFALVLTGQGAQQPSAPQPSTADLVTTAVTIQRLVAAAIATQDLGALRDFVPSYRRVRSRIVDPKAAEQLAAADRYISEVTTLNADSLLPNAWSYKPPPLQPKDPNPFKGFPGVSSIEPPPRSAVVP